MADGRFVKNWDGRKPQIAPPPQEGSSTCIVTLRNSSIVAIEPAVADKQFLTGMLYNTEVRNSRAVEQRPNILRGLLQKVLDTGHF